MPSERSLRASGKKWKQTAVAYAKGVLRRKADALLPSREMRQYQAWMTERKKIRKAIYTQPPQPGLLSILTPVWNGSPVKYLRELARSIAAQNRAGACEWVVLDNGCSKRDLLACLDELSAHSWVKIARLEENIGITRGLRRCLEEARGRYVLPVDADDLLYDDALRIVTSGIMGANYPPLLYTDEDKVIATRRYQPYFKPDWDPVLLLNSAYVAHLGVIDREKALALGAYTDAATEASPDWDLFVRFLMAGYSAMHIPEVVYSWRVHANSTADDEASKPYVFSSQKSVLQRYLDSRPDSGSFAVERSRHFSGAAHWHFVRRDKSSKAFASVILGGAAGDRDIATIAREIADQDGVIHFVGADVKVDDSEWQREVGGILELYPDTVMIGGRIRNSRGVITEAGRCLGFHGACGCPDHGRAETDPGYFGQMWKQRSVSAVSTQFAVITARFLLELFSVLPESASLEFLGAWAGAHALKTGRRVIYTPFLCGVSDTDWDTLASAAERTLFLELNHGVIPDRRFYSRPFSLEQGFTLSDPGYTTFPC